MKCYFCQADLVHIPRLAGYSCNNHPIEVLQFFYKEVHNYIYLKLTKSYVAFFYPDSVSKKHILYVNQVQDKEGGGYYFISSLYNGPAPDGLSPENAPFFLEKLLKMKAFL